MVLPRRVWYARLKVEERFTSLVRPPGEGREQMSGMMRYDRRAEAGRRSVLSLLRCSVSHATTDWKRAHNARRVHQHVDYEPSFNVARTFHVVDHLRHDGNWISWNTCTSVLLWVCRVIRD